MSDQTTQAPTPWVPPLGLDYAVYERMHMSAYGWGSWGLIAVFLNESDAEKFVQANEAKITQRKVFVTGDCWQRWHTQADHHHHEGCRKMYRGWIEKYRDAHISGKMSRYQLPDL